MKLGVSLLIFVTTFLVMLYIWGFYFFKSPGQVFEEYERALVEYAHQMRIQEEAGLKAGLGARELSNLREAAIVDLEGDMKRIVADFEKDWSAMRRIYLEYARRSGSWFTEGLTGVIVTQDNPDYHTLLALYNLIDDPDSYCLLFIPETNGSRVFNEFSGARLYYLQKTLWGYRIEWSKSLIDLLLGKDITSIAV
ncbi:MAG: hypothetical protein GXY62_05465 [Thermotogaceae bacterium]|nr:hypothetical protein [Mesotoga sp.]MDI9374707.1 hypothetical protein [Thermotogota bacterium]NLX33760.1 hypothetical protein [Thermotogaceae bacterium]MDD4041233.1 hypothetical protein [Mesotoga sp.]MDD4478832.1 hypothetical protein [Mesotoga sp.]